MKLEDIADLIEQKGEMPPGFLAHPDKIVWPGEASSTREHVRGAAARLCPDGSSDFFAFLVAGAILSARKYELLKALENTHQPTQYSLNLSWSQVHSLTWLGIPLAVSDGNDGRIVYAFLGQGAQDNSRASLMHCECMSPDAVQAVDNAAILAGQGDFVFWVPGFLGTSIKGKSLGLPVYLALMLMHKLTVWPQLVCTGELDKDGTLLPVSGVEQKAGAAGEHGFEGLMHPRQKDLQVPEYLGIEMLPVSDTSMALALAESYCPGKGSAQLFFYQERNNPDHAISHLCSVDLRLLRFFQEREEYLGNWLASRVQGDSEARERLINRLKESLDSGTQDLNRAYYILNHVFGLETAKALCRSYPRQAFSIARMHMEIMNHQGILQGLDDWYNIAREALGLFAAEKNVDAEEVLVGIYSMVGGLQNSYLFVPDKALEIASASRPALARLEKEFASRKEKMALAVNDPLGRYYGTMAQHYGFCGPLYMDTCLYYCDLTQEAFGNGEYQPKLKDWMRAFSYRFFAWLDAGELEKARAELVHYLENPIEALDYDLLNKFEHFHLARFLAETGAAGHKYVQWSIKALQCKMVTIKQEHPWQLWALNIGRLVQDPETRKEFWKTSIDTCRKNGPTMQVMALMPLGCLWHAELDSPGYLSSQATRVLQNCRNTGLWEKHFEPLWSMPGTDVLAEVMDKPARYFPFSYR